MSAAAARGNPYLTVRLPRETHKRLKEVVGAGDGGRAGGVALFVRRMIYRELSEPMPDQWGKEAGSLNDLIEVSKEINGFESDGFDTKNAVSLFQGLQEVAVTEKDSVSRNFALTLLGRLSVLLLDNGALKLSKP